MAHNSPETDSDRGEIVDELTEILAGRLAEIETDRAELDALLEHGSPPGSPDVALLRQAANDLREAHQRLSGVCARVQTADEVWRLGPTLAYELRRAASLRTGLLRHTPALAGAPRALHPSQWVGATIPEHLIDYARSGARLYAAAGGGAPTLVGRDQPMLAGCAEAARSALAADDRAKGLLFSSGTGAINTTLDYLAHVARKTGRRNVLGQRSWMEVRSYVEAELQDVFSLVDESDPVALGAAARDPAVFGVVVETVVNDPSMPVTPLTELLAAFPRDGRPRALVIDAAHLPDFTPSWPAADDRRGPTLISVVSGVKFLQAGLDISSSGLLVFWQGLPSEAYDRILELRERSGRTPTPCDALLAALETRSSLRSRLARYDRNTRWAAEFLAVRLAGTHRLRVCSPWLPEHPHHQRAIREFGSGGRIIYLSAPGDPAGLRGFDHRLCRVAEQHGLPAISACTFGLCVPHASCILDARGVFHLRVSPGSAALGEVQSVFSLWADSLAAAFPEPRSIGSDGVPGGLERVPDPGKPAE